MTRLPLPGFWYGENCYRPDGSHGYWASPIRGGLVQTEHGQIPTDPLLFTRGYPFGRFAGQSAIGLTGTKEYQESDGSGKIVGDGYGNNPVLYLRDGTLVQGAPQYGADGLRYQADDGSIVTSDASHVSPDGLLANYTELHGVRVGQDQIAGLGAIVQVLTHPGGTGPRYLLEPSANAIAIRMTTPDGTRFAIYVVKLAEQMAVAFWLTKAEISLLTPYPAPPVAIGPTTPPRTADGHLYDVRPFLLSDPTLQPRIGPTYDSVKNPTDTQYETPIVDDVFYYVKFGTAQAYECRSLDLNWLCLLEDGSANPPQHFTDARWFPSHLAIGEARAFITGPHQVVSLRRMGCQETGRDPINRKMWLLAVYDGWQWGKDLGVRPTIRLVYDNTDGFYAEDREIEVWDFADGAGACRFEAHRSDIVYANKHHPEFTDASRTARTDFYLVGGPKVQPAITGCVPQVCPHLPPLAPPAPPGGFHPPVIFQPGGSMLQEKGGILGVGGKFARFGPVGSGLFGRRGLIWDGDVPTGDYEFTLTETNPGRGQAVDTKNSAAIGADLTQYSTDETHQFYGLKPGETPGEYETPFLYIETDQNVKALVFRFPQAPDRPHAFVTSLTWVTQ